MEENAHILTKRKKKIPIPTKITPRRLRLWYKNNTHFQSQNFALRAADRLHWDVWIQICQQSCYIVFPFHFPVHLCNTSIHHTILINYGVSHRRNKESPEPFWDPLDFEWSQAVQMVKCYLYIVVTFTSLEVSYFQVCSSLLSETYIYIYIK